MEQAYCVFQVLIGPVGLGDIRTKIFSFSVAVITWAAADISRARTPKVCSGSISAGALLHSKIHFFSLWWGLFSWSVSPLPHFSSSPRFQITKFKPLPAGFTSLLCTLMMLMMHKETNAVRFTSYERKHSLYLNKTCKVQNVCNLDLILFVTQAWLPCFVASTTSSKIMSPTTTRTKRRTLQNAAPQSTHRGGYCAVTSETSPD